MISLYGGALVKLVVVIIIVVNNDCWCCCFCCLRLYHQYHDCYCRCRHRRCHRCHHCQYHLSLVLAIDIIVVVVVVVVIFVSIIFVVLAIDIITVVVLFKTHLCLRERKRRINKRGEEIKISLFPNWLFWLWKNVSNLFWQATQVFTSWRRKLFFWSNSAEKRNFWFGSKFWWKWKMFFWFEKNHFSLGWWPSDALCKVIATGLYHKTVKFSCYS